MGVLERVCVFIRHSQLLQRADWLWNRLRPVYERFVRWSGKSGLRRCVNGLDMILVSPECRGISEVYEPQVWNRLMACVRPGDVFADVGAYVGLYTVAVAKRVGQTGRVVAFEPDQCNLIHLKRHVVLNHVETRVQILRSAVGNTDGWVSFVSKGCYSSISDRHPVGVNGDDGYMSVPCVTLDTVFARDRLNILKVDVEGHEEDVLRGGRQVLSDESRRPRWIFIEVHPYAWPALGTSSDSLLCLLAELGYLVSDLEGQRICRIDTHGEIVAQPVEKGAGAFGQPGELRHFMATKLGAGSRAQ